MAYYNKYFETNWNNIKNTWKGIKSLIYLNTVAFSAPTVFSLDNGNTITIPYDIANNLNNYFASEVETTILRMSMIVQYFFNLPVKKK